MSKILLAKTYNPKEGTQPTYSANSLSVVPPTPKNDVLVSVPGHEVGLLQVLGLDDRDLEPTVEHGDRVGGFD